MLSCMCRIMFRVCLKHNSLPLGPIQPSSPNKELHALLVDLLRLMNVHCYLSYYIVIFNATYINDLKIYELLQRNSDDIKTW